jgi:hypothetical protein
LPCRIPSLSLGFGEFQHDPVRKKTGVPTQRDHIKLSEFSNS